MQQVGVRRSQEFRKCIECYLCQNTCHVIRDRPENEDRFAGPRFLMRIAELEMHPADTADRRENAEDEFGLGYCNITRCSTEVCPENIKITDNALIPLKERAVGREYDPLVWLKSRITRRPHAGTPKVPGKNPRQELMFVQLSYPGRRALGLWVRLLAGYADLPGMLAVARSGRDRPCDAAVGQLRRCSEMSNAISHYMIRSPGESGCRGRWTVCTSPAGGDTYEPS